MHIMAKIKDDVKKEIIRWLRREELMNLTESAIEIVKSKGGWFGGRQYEEWLQVKQNFIQRLIDDNLGSYAKFTTSQELERWAEEEQLPVRLIVNCFGTLCRDSFAGKPNPFGDSFQRNYVGKPSKSSVIEYASQVLKMGKAGLLD